MKLCLQNNFLQNSISCKLCSSTATLAPDDEDEIQNTVMDSPATSCFKSNNPRLNAREKCIFWCQRFTLSYLMTQCFLCDLMSFIKIWLTSLLSVFFPPASSYANSVSRIAVFMLVKACRVNRHEPVFYSTLLYMVHNEDISYFLILLDVPQCSSLLPRFFPDIYIVVSSC